MTSRKVNAFYESESGAIYVYLDNSPNVVIARTIEQEPGLMFDLNAKGKVIGVEVLIPDPYMP